MEGTPVLNGFDIFSAAGAANTAVDRSFDTTVSDGVLSLVFTGTTSRATVNAIAVSSSAGPDFVFTASPGSQTIAPGGSVIFTVNVSFTNGFTSTDVDLWTTGLPAGVTGTYSPDPLTHEGMSQLTLTAASSVAAGTFTLTLGATGGGITHSQNVTLVVSRTPDFSIAVSPATQTVSRGGSAAFTVAVGALNGFSNAVSLSASGLPSGTSVAFSPISVTPPGTSTMTVAAAANATIGQFALSVRGTSGTRTRSGSATLIVSSAGAAWRVSAAGSTGVANNSMIVGPGRNDGVSRLYVGTVNTGRVMEFSWNGTGWNGPVDIGGSSVGEEIHNLTMGPGRNDGRTRIYACSLDENLYQLTFNGTGWNQATVGTPGGACTHAVVGNGRNDGVNRLYATRGQAVWEYTWNGSGWTALQVGRVSAGIVHGISLGAGRGGSQNHLYIASTSSGTFEATFSAGAWSMISMGDTGDVRNVSVGAGRNDGAMRVYAGIASGRIREFTWNGSSWSNAAINSSIGTVIVHAYVLAGRNDGVMRVYGSAGDGSAYEFTFGGTGWTVVRMGGGTNYLYGFAYGRRPGDGTNRLYGAAFDGNVYEFSWG